MANAMQLDRRSKDAIEARHVGIVHEIEIALYRLGQSIDAGASRFGWVGHEEVLG
jgi:hypothetical protein